MSTDECYIILSFLIGSSKRGIRLYSDKIYGYDKIMEVGHLRDRENLTFQYTTGHTIDIEERYGFGSFKELEKMHEMEKKKRAGKNKQK